MGHLGPKGGTQGGAQGSHLRGYINRGGAPKNPNPSLFSRVNSTLLQYQRVFSIATTVSPLPPVRQGLGHPRVPSSPDRDASSRTCGLRGGAALAAQGRAVREVVHATALPASICTTPTRYRSSATARLVVIP